MSIGYDRGYDDGLVSGRDEGGDEVNAAWVAALGDLFGLMNAYEIGTCMGTPEEPGEVRERILDLAKSLHEKLGDATGQDLPEWLQPVCVRHAREDAEVESERRERDRLMGEFWSAVREGRSTAELERELERYDVSEEWIENTRKAAA